VIHLKTAVAGLKPFDTPVARAAQGERTFHAPGDGLKPVRGERVEPCAGFSRTD